MELKELKGFPTTKSGVARLAFEVVDDITEGLTAALDDKIILKGLETLKKEIESYPDFKEAVEIEADRYYEKTFDYKGGRLSKTERPRYDYSVCNDTVYDELMEEKRSLDLKIKEREKFLQHLKERIFDTQFGNEIYPPEKKVASILSVSLKDEVS